MHLTARPAGKAQRRHILSTTAFGFLVAVSSGYALGDAPVELTGVLTVIHLDDFVSARTATEYVLQDVQSHRRVQLHFTDGEPTAHLEGRELVLMYPPSERTARSTLQEVQACAGAGIQISTFALIEDYFYLGLMNFVDQMARTGQGLAIYCNAGELGGAVLDSFVRGRRSRKKLG